MTLMRMAQWRDGKGRAGLTLLRARGAASGVLGDDSLAVSDVELSEELLLESSLVEGRLVANCRMDETRSLVSR